MRHGLSLRWRIVLVIFALQLVLSAALLFFTLRQHLTSQEALWQRNDQNFVTLLSDLGRVALLTDDYTELQAFIAETASSGEFIDIVLVDLAGRVVAAKDQADLGSRLEPGPMIAGPDRWVVEVSAGEHRLGTLVVAVSDAALHASFGDAYRRGALVAGIGIVLMAVVRLLVRPPPDPPSAAIGRDRRSHHHWRQRGASDDRRPRRDCACRTCRQRDARSADREPGRAAAGA